MQWSTFKSMWILCSAVESLKMHKHEINPVCEYKRIPLSYWGIFLTFAIYKVLSCVQFNHIYRWAESNNIMADE